MLSYLKSVLLCSIIFTAIICVKFLFSSCSLAVLFLWHLILPHCCVYTVFKAARVKMDKTAKGGNSSNTAATLYPTQNNKDSQTGVYYFMVSPVHKFRCTPFCSTHSPPAALCLTVFSFSTASLCLTFLPWFSFQPYCVSRSSVSPLVWGILMFLSGTNAFLLCSSSSSSSCFVSSFNLVTLLDSFMGS